MLRLAAFRASPAFSNPILLQIQALPVQASLILGYGLLQDMVLVRVRVGTRVKTRFVYRAKVRLFVGAGTVFGLGRVRVKVRVRVRSTFCDTSPVSGLG